MGTGAGSGVRNGSGTGLGTGVGTAGGPTVDNGVERATPARIDDTDEIASGPTVYLNSSSVGGGDGTLQAIDATTGDRWWTLELGPAATTPIVVDGTLYVTDGDVFAYDAATGNLQWRQDLEDTPIRSAPTVVDDTVYLADSQVVALDRHDGRLEWSREIGSGVVTPPVVVDDTAYILDMIRGTVHAMATEDGEDRWLVETNEGGLGRINVAGSTIWFSRFEEWLAAYDAGDGSHQWTSEGNDQLITVPVVDDEHVYVGSLDNTVYAIDPVTGDREWFFSTGESIISAPTVSDGSLYVCSLDERLYRLATDTGTGSWSVRPGPVGSRPFYPTVVEETVYVLVERIQSVGDHGLHQIDQSAVVAIDVEDGHQRWQTSVASTQVSGLTYVADPTAGSSVDSRTNTGVDGHHDTWAERSQSIEFEAGVDSADTDGRGFHLGSSMAGMAGLTYAMWRFGTASANPPATEPPGYSGE